jgi:hypothetical protein
MPGRPHRSAPSVPSWEFHWPGDHWRGSLSIATYPVRVPNAQLAGGMLVTEFLNRLRDDQTVSIVAHSLRCRVALEAIQKIRALKSAYKGARIEAVSSWQLQSPNTSASPAPHFASPIPIRRSTFSTRGRTARYASSESASTSTANGRVPSAGMEARNRAGRRLRLRAKIRASTTTNTGVRSRSRAQSARVSESCGTGVHRNGCSRRRRMRRTLASSRRTSFRNRR